MTFGPTDTTCGAGEGRAVLEEAIGKVLIEEDLDPPRIKRVVLEGGAAERLVQRANDAELLLVGHRGRGGFASLLLGSVTHQVAAHATCPVTIVR